jgi:hypothetical protein
MFELLATLDDSDKKSASTVTISSVYKRLVCSHEFRCLWANLILCESSCSLSIALLARYMCVESHEIE